MTIYGTDICKDCVAFKAGLDAKNIEYDFKDICKDTKYLSEFMKLRDTDPVFDKIKGTGSIGIPAIMLDSENVSIDWEGFLNQQ